jgi:hypothetical protein
VNSCLKSRGVEAKEVIEKKEPNKATGLDVTYSLNVGYITYTSNPNPDDESTHVFTLGRNNLARQ